MFSMYSTRQSWQVSVVELYKTVKSGREELQLLVFAYTANIHTVSPGRVFHLSESDSGGNFANILCV